MSFIDVDDLAALLPDLIADALRTKDTRPVTPSDHVTKTSGVVEGIDGFTALVQLDDDRPGHITPVQMAAQVAVGDRPVILVSPNGGMVIVGNGGLSGTGSRGGVFIGGEPWTAFGTVIPALTTLVPTHGSSISGVELTLLRKPFPGRNLIVDVLLDGVTIFPNVGDRPTYLPSTVNPYRVSLATPISSTSDTSMVQGQIIDGGSAGWLRFGVLP